jgi:hypothetical protein
LAHLPFASEPHRFKITASNSARLTVPPEIPTMSVLRFIIALAMPLACSLPAAAADPTGYACVFNEGAARSFDKGRYKIDKPGRVAFDIASINIDQQTAGVKRGESTAVLRVVRAVNALHFLEIVGEGFMNVTTVYDRDAKAVKHPAVHSRHFGLLGQPIFSQYYGYCSAA